MELLQMHFHHYDTTSVTTEINKITPIKLLNRKNTKTGASASDFSTDQGDFVENELVVSCPHFRNEIPSPTVTKKIPHLEILEYPTEQHEYLENLSNGCGYYRKYFYGNQHDNWFACCENLGWVGISVFRGEECVRVVFRTSWESTTLRGSISPSLVPMATRNKNSRDVVDFLFPFLSSCQMAPRLGLPSAAQILLKLDEQAVNRTHKIGILYCRSGQNSEEEMYNNEFGSRNFDEFLDFLGDRVRLKGFQGYSGGLDVKDDTTGTHSIYNSTFHPNLELMFHVSTLLPFTGNNRQQILRKRHIGNDIVTIVFQEPGSRPFTAKTIRSQFQHVFIVVRLLGDGSYGLISSRSREVPPFGPPINSSHFVRGPQFLKFLLSKIINAENATYKTEKFATMATRTRNETLKDAYLNHTSGGVAELRGRFSMLHLLPQIKKKPPPPPTSQPSPPPPGALSFTTPTGTLAISPHYLIHLHDNRLEFVIETQKIVAWETEPRIIYFLEEEKLEAREIPEISDAFWERLGVVNKVAMETEKFFITREREGNLGFHIQNDGLITDIEPHSPAFNLGLKCHSHLVRLNSMATRYLTAEEMIRILKSMTTVEIVVIGPGLVPTSREQQINHLNWFPGGSDVANSPRGDYLYLQGSGYSSSGGSGYGTGGSGRSGKSWEVGGERGKYGQIDRGKYGQANGNLPLGNVAPLLPRRGGGGLGSGGVVGKSCENVYRFCEGRSKGEGSRLSVGCDRDNNLNLRVAALKSHYLTPKKRPPEKPHPQKSFQEELLKLIDIPPTTPPQPQKVQNNGLESRVALLERQLLEEKAVKVGLLRDVERLKRFFE